MKIGITGHIKLENILEIKNDLRTAIVKILSQNKVSNFTAISSLATGADTLFAEVAHNEFGAEIEVIVPFPLEIYENDFDEGDRMVFKEWLAKSKSVQVLNPDIPATRDDRNIFYLQSGKAITDKCDVLLAMWNGEPAKGLGGTADIVEYAWLQGKNIHIVDANKIDNPEKTEVKKLYRSADEMADKLRDRYNLFWLSAVRLSVIAALMLAYGISFELKGFGLFFFSFLELVCISVAVVLGYYMHKKELKQNRIIMRRDAERLRTLETFIEGGIPTINLDKSYDVPSENDRTINALEEKHNHKNHVISNLRFAKVKIGLLIGGQIEYHNGNYEKLTSKLKQVEQLLNAIKFAFIIGLLLHVVTTYGEWKDMVFIQEMPWLSHLALLISLALPPLYAGIEGYKYFKDWEHFKQDSERMIILLNKINWNLIQVDHSESLKKLANNVRQEMYNENVIWASIIKNKETHTL